MPAYFSVNFLFKEDVMYPNFVRDVYTSFFKMGYDFKSGFWFHENATLEEIINWNQKLLERKFRLGFKQHVKNDYMQMLLKTDLFEEMRCFWLYREKEFYLSLIVPEYDILDDDNSYKFIQDKINSIISLSENVWNTGLVTIIQSCPEEGGSISLNKIETGQIPSIHPFCIVGNNMFSKFSNKLLSNLEIRNISADSIIIMDKSL